VLLCCVLAILQYRWLGELALAERKRLQDDLQSRLRLLQRSFDDQISSRTRELVPGRDAIEALGREQAYREQYRRVQESKPTLVGRVALAIPERGSLRLEIAQPDASKFVDTPWPEEWTSLRDRQLDRLRGEGFRPQPPAPRPILEIPRFDAGGHEQEWLIVELNLDTLRTTTLPALLHRYLASEGRPDYDAEVVTNSDPPRVIYRSGQVGTSVDASVTLLDLPGNGPVPGRGPGPPPGRRGPPPGRPGPPPPDASNFPPPRGPNGPPDRGQLTLRVYHRAGSLEAIGAQARWRNVALSGAILLLILVVAAALLRLSRQRQRMAELEMNFVAAVSHELRTPLTVIRTAAFNLRGKLANNPEQVERYGQLIQEESEKLTALVEHVLSYGSTKAGQVIRRREPVDVESVIGQSLASAERAGLVVEKHIQPQLPRILADEVALRHAIQNLVENAVKHGGNGEKPWIGIFAEAVPSAGGTAVEIRVVDRGPGISADEREHIFDPFFRGRRALADQIHGTGLGLNLVKKIVEAHGGVIQVKSEPSQGAEFIVRIPAAPPEVQHEFAHSLG
jgi:signal transduction histidine kinase